MEEPPTLTVYPSEIVNSIIDGTYLTKDLCLDLYRNNILKFLQPYQLNTKESYKKLKEDLENLPAFSVQIESIPCDGHRDLLFAQRDQGSLSGCDPLAVHDSRPAYALNMAFQ